MAELLVCFMRMNISGTLETLPRKDAKNICTNHNFYGFIWAFGFMG